MGLGTSLGLCLIVSKCRSSTSLIDKGILHHTKPLPKVSKLHSGQGLGKYISDLLICGDVLEFYNSLLDDVSNIVIFHVDVLRPVMEHWVL